MLSARDYDEVIWRIGQAAQAQGVLDEVLRYAVDQSGWVGVTHASAYVPSPWVSDHPGLTRWGVHYLDQNFVATDPVLIGAGHSLLPQRWSARATQLRSRTPGARVLLEAGEFGLSSGLCVPLPAGGSGFPLAFFSFFSEGEELAQASSAQAAQLVFVATAAQERLRVFHESTAAAPAPSVLTPRETSCLSWVMHGLTAAEIAERLTISERTVVFHLTHCRIKLQARNLPQAVARALALGEIHW